MGKPCIFLGSLPRSGLRRIRVRSGRLDERHPAGISFGGAPAESNRRSAEALEVAQERLRPAHAWKTSGIIVTPRLDCAGERQCVGPT
jgi:hypothetical protein